MGNNNEIHLVSPDLLQDIEQLKKDLEGNESLSVECMRKRQMIFQESANRHSVEMEMLSSPNTSRRIRRKEIEADLQRLRLAYGEGLSRKASELLSPEFLKDLALLLAPLANPDGFRNANIYVAHPSGNEIVQSSYVRPGPHKIERELGVSIFENCQ